jgi:hypothetical protein
MSATYDLLAEAINKKAPCIAVYSGAVRVFCPQVLGYKNGAEQVLVWQSGGNASIPLPPGGDWRCFAVTKIQQLQLAQGAWFKGNPGSKPETCVDDVRFEAH